ncbi:MAG TPA: hypothetical protein VHF02_01370 [Luteimonas sp.]|nr:hypothetical protein [Luteimonas sp.]
MHGYIMLDAGVVEQAAVVITVVVVEKNRGTVDAPLRHMQGNAWKFKTRTTRHGGDC